MIQKWLIRWRNILKRNFFLQCKIFTPRLWWIICESFVINHYIIWRVKILIGLNVKCGEFQPKFVYDMNAEQQDKHDVRRGTALMDTRAWAQRSRIRCCVLLNVDTAEGDKIRSFRSNVSLGNRQIERNGKYRIKIHDVVGEKKDLSVTWMLPKISLLLLAIFLKSVAIRSA